MVEWARINAENNALGDAPIRWIVDDACKFLQREVRRGRQYDLIILDPPSFGRGKKGEIFKIEEHLPELLELCKSLLSDNSAILLSCHTPGYTPVVLKQLLEQNFGQGDLSAGEMLLTGDKETFSVALGSYATWRSR
jgi:23S rRNA (cytosine1962-C5)-methyltransferase